MPKASNDLILRDRLQFDVQSGGDRTTLYGRVDLSDYVNVVKKDGLSIKEIFVQPRVPAGDDGFGNQTGMSNTGAFTPYFTGYVGDASTENTMSCLKIYGTTRAYQNASDVGIASPDVLFIEEFKSGFGVDVGAGQEAQNFGFIDHIRYGPKDLHPDGFIVVSDLLIGVAGDELSLGTLSETVTIELDIMMIAQPVKITQARLDEMLAQAQDL